MKTGNVTKGVLDLAREPFEALKSQVAQPILEEAATELGGFLGTSRPFGKKPTEIAKEELKRARDKEKLDERGEEDNQNSQEEAQTLSMSIQNEYQLRERKTNSEQNQLKEEVLELQSEVVKLAKAAGLETNAHLETTPKKIGVIDIKRLTAIIRFLRIKAEESKTAKELVMQRSNAKRTTGMLAWVSGKQMKVHEQGTLMLQG